MDDIKKSDIEHLAESIEKKSEISEQPITMVSFKDLFTPSFMANNTQFPTFSGLLIEGNYIVNSFEEFMANINPQFDEFINKTTNFHSWDEMQSAAVTDYLESKKS